MSFYWDIKINGMAFQPVKAVRSYTAVMRAVKSYERIKGQQKDLAISCERAGKVPTVPKIRAGVV